MRVRLLIPISLVAVLLLAGCGRSGGSRGDRVSVMATTAFAADLARGVAGAHADVDQIIPASASPHSYALSAKGRADVEKAGLLVEVGSGYEAGLALRNLGAESFAITDHVGPLRELDGGNPDPHVWMDPMRMAAAAPALAKQLGSLDPAHAADYRRNARSYAARISALDSELRATLASVPKERRKLVTSHDALGYFADRYGFRVVATAFGLAPEADASAASIDRVIGAVKSERVPVVFSQRGDNPKVMRRVAQEAGVRVVDDLLVENPDPDGGTYSGALRFDARRIAEALRR